MDSQSLIFQNIQSFLSSGDERKPVTPAPPPGHHATTRHIDAHEQTQSASGEASKASGSTIITPADLYSLTDYRRPCFFSIDKVGPSMLEWMTQRTQRFHQRIDS